MTINPASSPGHANVQLQALPSVPDKNAQDRFEALLNSDPSNVSDEQNKKLTAGVDRSGTVGEPLKELRGVMSGLQAKLHELPPGEHQHPLTALPAPASRTRPA